MPYEDSQIFRFFIDLYFFKFIIYGLEEKEIDFFFFNKFDGFLHFNNFFFNLDFFFIKGKLKIFSYYFLYTIHQFIFFLTRHLKVLRLRRNIYFKIYHFYSKFGIFTKFNFLMFFLLYKYLKKRFFKYLYNFKNFFNFRFFYSFFFDFIDDFCLYFFSSNFFRSFFLLVYSQFKLLEHFFIFSNFVFLNRQFSLDWSKKLPENTFSYYEHLDEITFHHFKFNFDFLMQIFTNFYSINFSFSFIYTFFFTLF